MGRDTLMTKTDMINYLKNSMNTFIADPPDSDYQRGYLAALKEMKDLLKRS
jgi:hypothetical protein